MCFECMFLNLTRTLYEYESDLKIFSSSVRVIIYIFKLVPLGRVYPLTASEFYQKLMEEAEAERKAKKRNQLSGIYK